MSAISIGTGNFGGGVLAREKLPRPSRFLLLAEWRGLLDLGAGLVSMPALMAAPRGDGHPVLVLPGFMASDRSTDLLRFYLGSIGYKALPWGMGRNLGGVYSMRQKLRALLAEIHRESGRKVTLVGWSLGGVYARDLALSMPDQVRAVITLGSPFNHDVGATNASGLYKMMSGESVHDADPADLEKLAGDLPVPATAIFTRTDGVVHWKTSVLTEGPRAENIEVMASHVGLGVAPGALWAIADRLAQPEGSFEPFKRQGPFAMTYPRRSADC